MNPMFDYMDVIGWVFRTGKAFPRCRACRVLYADYNQKICSECVADGEFKLTKTLKRIKGKVS